MSKTPLNELKEYVHTLEPDTHSGMAMYNAIMRKITALLPTERDVIEEAWNTGKEDGKDMSYHGRAEHTSAQHYFTTKFNDNEHTKS